MSLSIDVLASLTSYVDVDAKRFFSRCVVYSERGMTAPRIRHTTRVVICVVRVLGHVYHVHGCCSSYECVTEPRDPTYKNDFLST